MEDLLKHWTAYLASGVEGIAALIVAFAALQAAFSICVLLLRVSQRDIAAQGAGIEVTRLRLGRWLTLALEFELGADILRTAISPSWTEIGQLAAIATIRTLLNYFLQKEVERAAQNLPNTGAQSL